MVINSGCTRACWIFTSTIELRGILEAADRQYAGRCDELMDRDKKWLLLCTSSGRLAMESAVI